MTRQFNVHPHKAYLNNEVFITNLCDQVLEVYDNDNFLDVIQPKSIFKGKFTAGYHKITGKYHDGITTDSIEEFFVEDAIKLGGGRIVDGYIFNQSPWILLKMTDRLYFHNRETEEEFVEMNIVPDAIQALNQELLLFHTKSEGYSIYSLVTFSIIAKFNSDPLYVGKNSIVYSVSEDNIAIIYYEGAVSQKFNYTKYAINHFSNALYIYSDEMLFNVNLNKNEHSINLDLPGPVVNLMNNGCFICLLTTRSTNNLVVYKVDSPTVKINSSCLNANVISVSGFSFVESNYKDELKGEYDKIKALVAEQYSKHISLDFRYTEILDVFATCSDLCYKIRETYSTTYRTAEEYKLIIPRLNEEFKMYEYTKVHQQDECLFFELNSEVTILFNNTIRRIKGSLIRHDNRYYILSVLGDKKEISTIDGTILYTGNFEITKKIRSLITNEDQPVKVFEDYGWVFDTIEGNISLRNVFNKWSVTNYDALYVNRNCIIYECNDKYYSITAASFGTQIFVNEKKLTSLICVADSGNGSLNNIDGKIFYSWHSIFEGRLKDTRLFENIFDNASYSEALFANDGDCLVYADKNGKYFLRNLNVDEVTEFDSCKYIKHTNGYSPSLEITENRLPRIINPVTGQYVESNLFDFKFTSPDGMWIVEEPEELALDSVGGLECNHKVTKQVISMKEYNQLRQKLDRGRYHNSISEEMRSERLKLMFEYPNLFVPIIKAFCLEYSSWKKVSVSAYVIQRYCVDSSKLDKTTREALDFFVTYTKCFSTFIVDVSEYILIENAKTRNTRKINIGIPLWYMNYISFSYDSRFVAMAGRYEDDTMDEQRHSLGGLYLLYDLVEDKVVTKSTNTHAVWVTSFTNKGHIGYYDSHPTTYIANSEGECCACIGGRSFLTFSPSGKFFALSNQGYVRFDSVSPEKPAGHQPSTNVYIRSVRKPEDELAKFNDHGDKIKGVLTKRARTVAMVAFSPDDSRLLSISDDGVIVIRNLHLLDIQEDNYSYIREIADLPF